MNTPIKPKYILSISNGKWSLTIGNIVVLSDQTTLPSRKSLVETFKQNGFGTATKGTHLADKKFCPCVGSGSNEAFIEWQKLVQAGFKKNLS